MFFRYYFTFIVISCLSCFGYHSSWISPTVREQIFLEGKDDEIGKGRLFVPTMTFPDWEPEVRIYTMDGKLISGMQSGTSIFLSPGDYTVLWGSSQHSLDQVQKKVTIKKQETHILDVDWSGLIINIIDENMEKIRMGYELYHLDVDISAGISYSKVDDNYKRKRSTWILPPGSYKLVKLGEPHNTIVNFSTFTLQKNQLKEWTIVVDTRNNFNFIGSGEIPFNKTKLLSVGNWSESFFLKGFFSLHGNNDNSEKSIKNNYNFRTEIDNNVQYDHYPYFLSTKQNLLISFNKTEIYDDIQVLSDELSFNNTAIYYFTEVVGVYSEINISSSLLKNYEYYEKKINYAKRENNNLKYYKNKSKLKINDNIFPLFAGEEIGLNLSIFKEGHKDLYLRGGYGARQRINKDVYEDTDLDLLYDNDFYNLYEKKANSYLSGLVFTLGINFQFLGSLNYNSTGELFYALHKTKDYEITWKNNFNFKLFRYLSVDYNIDFLYNDDKDYLIYKHRLALEISYFFNESF